MDNNYKFDDIRPYYDHEIAAAMRRIAADPAFPLLCRSAFPTKTISEISDELLKTNNIRDFQMKMMYPAVHHIISSTISQFTYSGIENISPEQNYLFISNHRDIMLDATLLQHVLVGNGFPSTEITFGANLMMNQLIIDIGRSNKMFRVERPGNNARQFYTASQHLSDYLRHTITNKHASIWIAQRNGRTKDGWDATDSGIIKMFSLSDRKNKIRAITNLNIVPISISYEWEPCDFLKTIELYVKQTNKQYQKQPNEDLNSILTGLRQKKGYVHIHIGKPLNNTINRKQAEAATQTTSDFHHWIAETIDSEIIRNYRLSSNNYIAHDLLNNSSAHKDRYTEEQQQIFCEHLQHLEEYCGYDQTALKEIFLKIYANPIDNLMTKQ